MSTVKERVQAGINYLNTYYAGWIDKIDLSKLNMLGGSESKGRQCITQQLGISKHTGPDGYMLLVDFNLGFLPEVCSKESKLRNEWIKRITELRKPKPTVQQEKNKVFRQIVDGLIEQKLVRAVDKDNSCRYRTELGNKCAAGQLIPDCDYDLRFEGYSIDLGNACPSYPTVYFCGKYQKNTVKMISECQAAHDNEHLLGTSKMSWAKKMLSIYKEHKINSPVTQAKLQTIVALEVQ
jgi:hypothetical protein